ncbi:DUF2716 domain-containing protein [Streptomyces sp. NPDC005820]|uniref:DUF2716 domain-containing protein n=1 Tax=Streptomyces sp. NPDC005820 TaxID=3157069 RepID=UPI0033FCA589
MTVAELLAAHDEQLRGRVPPDPPWGTVTEEDGPVVRVHHGTHAVVEHRDLTGADLPGLVRRQQEVCAARVEPVEWKVYSHDTPGLASALAEAGFTAGPARRLLVAEIADMPAPRAPSSVRPRHGSHAERAAIHRLAAAAPGQRRPLSELEADGGGRGAGAEMTVLVLERHGRLVDGIWLERVPGTDFASVGGISGPRPELLHAAGQWAARGLWGRPPARYLVAEAGGEPAEAHLAAGFHEIAGVTTYRWAPPGEPARERPAGQLLGHPEHDEIWRRFEKRFEVTYETAYDGIAEPPGSVTWHMAAVDHTRRDPLLAEVEDVIARGLRARGRRGDRLYRLKWYISGSRCDPTRVGGPGQPRWPGYAYLVDENVIQVTADLRMGTYGNFVEESLCVFGADLVAEVEEDLTALLGTVLRRDGRPVGNVWSFGP